LLRHNKIQLALDKAFFEHFFVAEPQIWDVGGAEAEDVFERAADFAEMKIHADALEQFDKLLRANGFDGLRTGAVVVHTVVGENINGLRSGTVPVNVKETPGFGLGRGEPRSYT
jgi:hypothetical protein